MTPFDCGGGLPSELSCVLDGRPLASDTVFVVEFFLDNTPILDCEEVKEVNDGIDGEEKGVKGVA